MGGFDAILGLIVGFIVGAGFMFFFMRRNPNIVKNVKAQLAEVEKEKSAAVVDLLNFKAHLRNEIGDFPQDVKDRINDLLAAF